MDVEYFQVLEDGKSLHTYAELPLMAISYLTAPERRTLQGITLKDGSWEVSRVFTQEQARRIVADHLKRCAHYALRFPEPPKTFLLVEGEREIGVTKGLYEAALLWKENPGGRRVFRVSPSDGAGAGTWARIAEIAADEVQRELPQ